MAWIAHHASLSFRVSLAGDLLATGITQSTTNISFEDPVLLFHVAYLPTFTSIAFSFFRSFIAASKTRKASPRARPFPENVSSTRVSYVRSIKPQDTEPGASFALSTHAQGLPYMSIALPPLPR